MVMSLSIFDASIDWKWNSAMIIRMKIANNFETVAFTDETLQTADIKSRSPNRLVTSILFCDASIDRKWVSAIA
jgi:hypothetical protein